jgi:glycosyltransferase involved in cell wall biosynthesis
MGDGNGSGGPASALVDARALHQSGIGRYLREVLRRLIADGRFGRIECLGDPVELQRFAAGQPGSERVTYRSYTPAFYSPRVQLDWVRMTWGNARAPRVAFFPHFDAPLVSMPVRSVVTVQDLIHFMVPEAFPAWRRLGAGVVLRRVTATARRLIVSSHSTRRDLIGRLPGTAGKISVVPFGVEPDLFREEAGSSASAAVAKALRPYLLCVGNRKPHKNLVAAVEALGRLPGEYSGVRLVIVGATFRGDRVAERATELGIADRVVELGMVSDSLLRSLYHHCEALLFPSFYEGFGLPLLEAMAAGAPVVASNTSSMPEVIGDAGVLLAPSDHQGMADAVGRILADPLRRRELVSRGRERAAAFSWERAAKRVVDILWETAEGSVSGPSAGRRQAADSSGTIG